MKLIKWLLIIAILAGLGWLAKPYILPPAKPLSDGDQVDIRAMGWLKTMVDGDWAASYQYASPGYRSGVSENEHSLRMAARRVKWLGGQLLSHDCQQELCSVKIRVVFLVQQPMRGVKEFESFQVVEEKWLKSDGIWYLVQGK